jgi:hypothetical protein
MNCTDVLSVEPIKDYPCGSQVNAVRTITVYPVWWSPNENIKGLDEPIILKSRREVSELKTIYDYLN